MGLKMIKLKMFFTLIFAIFVAKVYKTG